MLNKLANTYLFKNLPFFWITGGHTIDPPIEGLLVLTAIEPTQL